MRAVHLLRKYNPSEWGGTETAIHGLFSGLREHQVRPLAYCPALRTGGAPDPLSADGFEITRFHACVPIWGITGEERQRLTAVSGNLVSFDLPGKLWREKEIEVIHSHALGRLGAVASCVARLRRIPFVMTIHGGLLDVTATVRATLNRRRSGLEWGKFVGALFGARGLLARADAVITCNAREAELLREANPGKRILVQPHGLPILKYSTDHRTEAREAFPDLRGRRFLLAVGRLDRVKNQRWLVRAARDIFQRHPDLVLVLAGASTDETYSRLLREDIKQEGLEDRVFFTGGMPPGDPRLIGLMQAAEAVVLPSISETFGLVILEAWASATLVISSRTSGARDLIRHGEDGWLFDLEDLRGFHEGIDMAMSQPGYRLRLAVAGAKRVREEYDCVRLAGRVKELYQELIQQKNAQCNLAR